MTLQREVIELKLEEQLEGILQANYGKTIATCESCTGGLISKLITNVSGASSVFGYGVCTYANEAKMKLLGVKEQTLTLHGAVSEETATEMALGMLKLSGADIAISTTGIAGPTGGTTEKPVGLVYAAIAADSGRYTKCIKMLLATPGSDRESIRSAAAERAMSLAVDYLKNESER